MLIKGLGQPRSNFKVCISQPSLFLSVLISSICYPYGLNLKLNDKDVHEKRGVLLYKQTGNKRMPVRIIDSSRRSHTKYDFRAMMLCIKFQSGYM